MNRHLPLYRLICLLGLLAFPLAAAVHGAEPKPQAGFKFVQLCDPQLGFGEQGYEQDLKSLRQAVRQINAIKPAFVIICGDLVHTPKPETFADFKKVVADLAMPCYCAAGNHDLGHPATTESLTLFRQAVGKDYYSFQHQGCTFVVVDTEFWKTPVEGETAAHDQWFAETLRQAKARSSPVFVAGHHPLFLTAADEKEEYFNIPPDKRAEILRLAKENGVVAILSGHTHRLIENQYDGIQLLSGEGTSKHFDKRPFGFRIWQVDEAGKATHQFVELQQQNE